jgi:hypothetical protein
MAALGLNDRKHKRKTFVLEGVVDTSDGSAPRRCAIVDISHGGACLAVDPMPLPRRFTLLLPGNVRRECMLKWRRGREAGVAFL